MTKREKNLVMALFWTAVGCSAFLIGGLGVMRLREIEASISLYRSQVANLSERASQDEAALIDRMKFLKANIATLEKNTANDGEGIASFGTKIRKLLVDNGNGIARYQVVKSKDEELLEFSVKGSPYSFLRFLRSATDEGWDVPYLSIRCEKPGMPADIVFRTRYAD